MHFEEGSGAGSRVSGPEFEADEMLENYDMEEFVMTDAEVRKMEVDLAAVLSQLDELKIDEVVQQEINTIMETKRLTEGNIKEVLEKYVGDFNIISKLLGANSAILKEWDIQTKELVKRTEKIHIHHPPVQRIWKIDRFQEHLSNAISRKATTLSSPFLFTHEYGYKIGVLLCPYGDGKVRGQFVSLFFYLVKGPYDNLQGWPFALPISFRLIDQNPDKSQRKDIVKQFSPNPDPANVNFLGQPKSHRNPSLGFPKFAALHVITNKDSHYVVDDTLYIKIVIDCASVVPL